MASFLKNCILSGAVIWCDISVPVTRNSFKSKNENYFLHYQCHTFRCTAFCLGALRGISSQPGASVNQTACMSSESNRNEEKN